MSPRTVEEWSSKNPDSKVPDHVRLRIFRREEGRCHLSGRKILPGDAWDLDHRVALRDGGEHRESNLFPALRDKHREKTAAEASERAIVDRQAKAHAGIRKPATMKAKPKAPRISKPSLPVYLPPGFVPATERRDG